MNWPLEDTLGDIVRKARISTQTSAETAATAAGLDIAEFEQFEVTGLAPEQIRWDSLGQLLTLNGSRLKQQGQGWRPESIDLGVWRHLRVITSSGSGMSVNCFLIWDESTLKAALFDTGFDAAPILDILEKKHLVLQHLFITHTHHDHVAALQPIRQHYPEAKLHSSSLHAPVDQLNRPGECIQIGSLRVTHQTTQGHAEDGVTYIVGGWPDHAPDVAIVGDAIFAGSMGGAKGQLELARKHVCEHILSLPPQTLICPGHGPLSTVEQETKNNPWF
jgi:glyoxylase-like metal-dependent hydrolase (beta-lactamase superfamily II)